MAKGRGTEFRKEAVRLVQSSGLTRKQLSEDLGVACRRLIDGYQKNGIHS